MFSLTAGRFPGIARWLKRYLVKVLIQRRRELDLSFRRQIEFLPDGVRVSDSLKGSDGERIASPVGASSSRRSTWVRRAISSPMSSR